MTTDKPQHRHVRFTKESKVNSYWRPILGWMYIAICTFDFIIAPILWTAAQAYYKGSIQTPWQPLTLQGAGLFHLAMGAILGIASYGRTKEKLNGMLDYDQEMQFGRMNGSMMGNPYGGGYGYSPYQNSYPMNNNYNTPTQPVTPVPPVAGKNGPPQPVDPEQ